MEIEKKFNRFKDAEWFSVVRDYNIIVGGIGGIGSWLSLLLSRISPKTMNLYDYDIIEEHNIGGQLFKTNSINNDKTRAIQKIISSFSEYHKVYLYGMYNDNSHHSSVMFSAFDNMEARKIMFEKWSSDNNLYKSIFIDGRLEAEGFQIFCVTPENIEEYKKHLFDDKDIPDLPCTLKQTSHFAAMIASFMVTFFTNHVHNINVGEKQREVPFEFSYFGPLNLIE